MKAIEDKDTECSLLIKRMIDKNEKCYFKIKTKEYDYFDQGWWRVILTPLIELPHTREVKFQIYATKHCPSGLWDNGIEKSEHYTYYPKAFNDFDRFLFEVTRDLMSSMNYKVENWQIK